MQIKALDPEPMVSLFAESSDLDERQTNAELLTYCIWQELRDAAFFGFAQRHTNSLSQRTISRLS